MGIELKTASFKVCYRTPNHQVFCVIVTDDIYWLCHSVYSIGTRVCLFNEVLKQVNSVIMWVLWMDCLTDIGLFKRAQNYHSLGLSMGMALAGLVICKHNNEYGATDRRWKHGPLIQQFFTKSTNHVTRYKWGKGRTGQFAHIVMTAKDEVAEW